MKTHNNLHVAPCARVWERPVPCRLVFQRARGYLRAVLHGQVVDALREMEGTFPVDEWRVADAHVWPIVRTHLSAGLLLQGRDIPARPALRARIPHFSSLKSSWNGARSNALPQSDAVFLSRPSNRQELDGVWYDRFCDPLADILSARGFSSVNLEYRTGDVDYLSPSYRLTLPIRRLVLQRLPHATFMAMTRRDHHLPEYERFLEYLEKNYPWLEAPSKRHVLIRAHATGLVADLFDRMFDSILPKVAFCSCYYSLVGMALCHSAKRKRIPVVDIQHGVTLKNPAYEGWTRFPALGYSLLPSAFWCWGDADTAPLDAWPLEAQKYHRAFSGGHPWFALWETPHALLHDCKDSLDAIRGPRRNVLVTLTWSSGMSPELKTIIQKSPEDWTWWIRLHPRMTDHTSQVRQWAAANATATVHVRLPTELPLPLLLRSADVHLTHNSTVVQEAAALGTPSVLIDEKALDVYERELESGWARYESDASSLYTAIDEQATSAPSLPTVDAYPRWQHVETSVLHWMQP